MSEVLDEEVLKSIDVVALARQIAVRLSPDALLEREDVAAMLKCEPRYVSEVYVKVKSFPAAYRLETTTGKSHPRWKRSEIQAWIDQHGIEKKRGVGRPRKQPLNCDTI